MLKTRGREPCYSSVSAAVSTLQYQADRQAQLRAYAESIAHYRLQLWERTAEGTFYRKTFPIFKYFPDHQLDIFPLLWVTTEAGIGDKELLLKFDGTVLPITDDKISVCLDYYCSGRNLVFVKYSGKHGD